MTDIDTLLRSRLHGELLAWFAENARDLPWRRTRDPYAIWISEAMLQQTRVETVIEYYERFLAALPTVEALAAAEEDEVLALWSGLGYYRRARSLHAAARAIVAEHGARFPREPDAALALPGVGRYTAGAVLSIAFGASVPVVDGNVARVFSRWFALEDPIGSTRLNAELWRRAEALVPPAEAAEGRGPGDWNQALMELGARVCTSAAPACEACPVAADCAARAAGRERDLPIPAKRRAPVDVRVEVLLVERDGALLVARRPPGGRMAGLHELPTRELANPAGDRVGLWPSEHALELREGEPIGEVRHAITHHRIRASVRAGAAVPEARLGADHAFVPRDDLQNLGLTGMTKKILARFGAAGLRPGSEAR